MDALAIIVIEIGMIHENPNSCYFARVINFEISRKLFEISIRGQRQSTQNGLFTGGRYHYLLRRSIASPFFDLTVKSGSTLGDRRKCVPDMFRKRGSDRPTK